MKAVVKAFRRCRKDTDFYRLIIDLENRLCPAEFDELDMHRRRLPERGREWLDKLQGMLTGEIGSLRPYLRRELGAHVGFYRSSSEESRPRDLVVAFCGGAHRLMVPVGVALQHIDDTRFDVVVVTDPQRKAYVSGIQGYASSFEDIFARLSADLDLDAYGSVRALGTSQGGSAALRFGRTVGVVRAISVGARAHPENMAKAAAAPRTEVFCIHGDGNADDRHGAEALASALDGRVVPVVGVDEHNILYEILKQGWLARFFDTVLQGSVPETLAGSWARKAGAGAQPSLGG